MISPEQTASGDDLADPLLEWVQPDEYHRYRTHLIVMAQPLWMRLGKVSIRFCLWFLPCFVLFYCFHLPVANLVAATFAALWLAFDYWGHIHHPTRYLQVSFYERYISYIAGKQPGRMGYDDIVGWVVVERPFEGHFLHILLLKYRWGYVGPWCLPDAGIRDWLSQLLQDKQIPPAPQLRPSWE